MSQQINLLLPELRPRFDWLALTPVVAASAAGILLLLAVGQFQGQRESRLKTEAAGLNAQVAGLQQQLQQSSQHLAARRPNPALNDQVTSLNAGLDQRRQVLAYVGNGGDGASPGFAGMLHGFARQGIEGVWLVGFGLRQDGLEMRGRLLDPALLPRYIERLNGDAAFRGRRFAALEMQGVVPAAPVAPAQNAAPSPLPAPYTEFVLRTESMVAVEKKP